MELEGILDSGLARETQHPLPVYASPLELAMEHKLHGCAFATFRLKGDGFLAYTHAEEIRIIGVVKHLISSR